MLINSLILSYFSSLSHTVFDYSWSLVHSRITVEIVLLSLLFIFWRHCFVVDFNIGTKQLSELRRSVRNEVATCLLLLLRSVYLLSSVRVVFRVLYCRGFSFWATYFLLIKKQIATDNCTLVLSPSRSLSLSLWLVLCLSLG